LVVETTFPGYEYLFVPVREMLPMSHFPIFPESHCSNFFPPWRDERSERTCNLL
jgi:hypothetical protein